LSVIVVVGVVVFFRMVDGPPHPVTISFNSNGADDGKVDAITCNSNEQVTLPSGNKLTRDGYKFMGWATERDGKPVYKTAATFSTGSDVTLYAQWSLSSTVEPYIVSCDQHNAQDGTVVVVLTVQNRSDVTVDMKADFTFNGLSAKTVDTGSDQALSVGAGEITVLETSSSEANIKDVSYGVTSTEPKYSNRSLASCVTMEEVSCNDSGLTIRITNKSEATAVLWYCVAYGKNDTGEFAYLPIQVDQNDQQLKPQKSRVVVFEGSQWKALDYNVYLFGFAK
jgi:uncharacterized repeat protein (TIGR02543 family)